MTGDALGDRMKLYERRETDRTAMPRLPLYARLDGRRFSGFTRGLARPFDETFSDAMILLTERLVAETHARIGYTQSDEISLFWHAEDAKTQLPFGGRFFKLTSCLAGLASAHFLLLAQARWPERCASTPPTFDCRAFSLPSRDELANAFLWRERDATKNAVSMAARAHYGPSELHLKSCSDMQETLWQKGVNFNDYPAAFKRGTFVRREVEERELSGAELERIPAKHRPDGPVVRSALRRLEMPPFGTVANRVEVLFEGAPPIVSGEDARPKPTSDNNRSLTGPCP